ncbi:hypothetical protein SLA2020_188840 [Shorea laevis]
MESSLLLHEPITPRAASLIVRETMEKSPEASSFRQSLKTGPQAPRPLDDPYQAGDPKVQRVSLHVGTNEAGFMLSEQIRTQLNLGKESNKGKKRRSTEEHWEEEVKRPRIQAYAESEPFCSPKPTTSSPFMWAFSLRPKRTTLFLYKCGRIYLGAENSSQIQLKALNHQLEPDQTPGLHYHNLFIPLKNNLRNPPLNQQ